MEAASLPHEDNNVSDRFWYFLYPLLFLRQFPKRLLSLHLLTGIPLPDGFLWHFAYDRFPIQISQKMSQHIRFPAHFPSFSSEDNYDTQGISQIVKISTHSKDAPTRFPAERMQPLKKAAFYSLFVFSPFFCPSSK